VSDTDLIAALKGIVGNDGVISDGDSLAPYLNEERGLYQGTAKALVKPNDTKQVSEIAKLCFMENVPIVAQGGNTGLVGGGVPHDAVLLNFERMNQIENIDAQNLTMTVQAGAILAEVQATANKADVYFPLSLGAEGSCRIGGNLSTNAGGIHVLRYGNACDLVLGLEVVMADGRIWNGLTALRKDNTGYDLKSLFLGAEGTLGIITRAVLRLFPQPRSNCVAFIGCDGFEEALNIFHIVRNRAADVVNACEVMNRFALDIAEKHISLVECPLSERHETYLLLEFASSDGDADLNGLMEAALGDAFEADLINDAVIAQSGQQADKIWALREAIPEAQKIEGGSIKHDVSVPVSCVPEFIRLGTKLVTERIPGVRVCAFGHLGDGNIHFNLSQPQNTEKQDFLSQWQDTNKAVHDVVVSLGGSFSAEHGIGQLKVSEMARLKSKIELDLMQTLKNSLDPKNIMNPGKVIPHRN